MVTIKKQVLVYVDNEGIWSGLFVSSRSFSIVASLVFECYGYYKKVGFRLCGQ